MLETIGFFGTAFAGLFAVVEPLGAVPMFAAVTRGRTEMQRDRVARRAAVIGGAVLLGFAVLGRVVLDALQIHIDAFRVAGGMLLLLMSLDMLRAKPAACRRPNDHEEDAAAREDLALAPIAIPVLAGPGAMATVLVLMSRASGIGASLAVLMAIVVTFAASYLVLRSASWMERMVGVAAMGAVQRVLGLLLAAMAVQVVTQGLRSLLAGD